MAHTQVNWSGAEDGVGVVSTCTLVDELPGSLSGSIVGLDLSFTETKLDGDKTKQKQKNRTKVEWCNSQCDHQVAELQLLF